MDRRRLVLIPDVADLALFAGCDRRQLARVRALTTAVLLPAGATVLDCGAPPRQFVVIADGEVVVQDRDGAELAVLGPGDIVGELGLLRDAPTAASVRTLTPVVAYVGNRAEFVAMLDVAPTIDRRVTHLALDRLRPTRAVS